MADDACDLKHFAMRLKGIISVGGGRRFLAELIAGDSLLLCENHFLQEEQDGRNFSLLLAGN